MNNDCKTIYQYFMILDQVHSVTRTTVLHRAITVYKREYLDKKRRLHNIFKVSLEFNRNQHTCVRLSPGFVLDCT